MNEDELGLIIKIVAVTISLCALALTIYNGYLTRKHYRVSLKPIICGEYRAKNDLFQVTIKNRGLGTAIIKKHTFLLDGQPVTSNEFYDDLRSHYSELGIEGIPKIHYISPNSSISKDEEFVIYKLSFTERYSDNIMKDIQKRYRFRFDFESLYGEKFIYESDSEKPE
jgi:hypothetical protein